MMEQMRKKVSTLAYVQPDPKFEQRKRRFYQGSRFEVEDLIYQDTMKQIGIFQLEENNLSHIKAFNKGKQQPVPPSSLELPELATGQKRA